MDNLNGTDNPKNSKKEFRRKISAKLEEVLHEFQSGIKEKKFKAAVKRAGKLMANDLFVKTKKVKNKKQHKEDVVEAEAEAINA
jgi:hypothetical protein